MRILFLASFYFDLYKPILKELENEGHVVILKEDIQLKADYHVRHRNVFIKFACWLYRKGYYGLKDYWKNQIRNDSMYNDRYDFFLCINGVSFHPYLLNHLKRLNPEIRSSLYVWDTSNFYNYYRYNTCFDNVFTFDYNDSIYYKDVKFLPSYWVPTDKKQIRYKLSMIGSDHDDRLSIVSNIYDQIIRNNITSFIRIVIKPPLRPNTWYRKILHNNDYKKASREWLKKKILPFTTDTRYSLQDVINIIDESECVLDTEMPIQSGASQRVIWALARGKKVITTNLFLKEMSFYREGQISFIDRNNPKLDINFINESKSFEENDELNKLRIDRWVKELIG